MRIIAQLRIYECNRIITIRELTTSHFRETIHNTVITAATATTAHHSLRRTTYIINDTKRNKIIRRRKYAVNLCILRHLQLMPYTG